MKVLSSYFKEMKIASRGIYFYIELITALIVLFALLAFVSEKPTSFPEEFLMYDIEDQYYEAMMEDSINKGLTHPESFETEFMLKPTTIELIPNGYDTSDGNVEFETITFEEYQALDGTADKPYKIEFNDKKTITLKGHYGLLRKTGERHKTQYTVDNLEDLLRVSYAEGHLGIRLYYENEPDLNNLTLFNYDYYTRGSETERYNNTIYMLHNDSWFDLLDHTESQKVEYLGIEERLNNRENILPVVVTFLSGMMGVLIIAAYIFNDKDEGTIKALAVSPTKVWQYLTSKILVMLTLSLFTCLVVTIPVMGGNPSYLLLIISLLSAAYFSACLGLLLASFFDTLTQAFGSILAIMMLFMLPSISYYVPNFSPLWVKFIPSYYMIELIKESILVNRDVGYVLIVSGILLASGFIIFLIANQRFKKTLTA